MLRQRTIQTQSAPASEVLLYRRRMVTSFGRSAYISCAPTAKAATYTSCSPGSWLLRSCSASAWKGEWDRTALLLLLPLTCLSYDTITPITAAMP
jgi:hypothetical protein